MYPSKGGPRPQGLTVEQAMRTLQRKGVPTWAKADRLERARLLRECVQGVLDHVDAATAASVAESKGGYESGASEEYACFCSAVMAMTTLAGICEQGGVPRDLPQLTHSLTGQRVVEVYPYASKDKLLFPDHVGEVWIREGEEPARYDIYALPLEEMPEVKTSLVLGAGNQINVVIQDVLHKLFHENQTVVLKMNPVNEYYGPYLEKMLRPLVDIGVLAFVYGGAEEGQCLCNHRHVDNVHITGSGATFDAIVWQGRAKQGTPPFQKAIAGELGNKTPYIICPGEWSEADMDYHVRQMVTGKVNNAGHNCVALEVLVTSKDWPQREQFLDKLRHHLAKTQNRANYYPGSAERRERFMRKYPGCEVFKNGAGGGDPWLLATDCDPETMEKSFEWWAGVLTEVALPGKTPAEFLPAATRFCNDELFGTLGCSLFIDDATRRTHVQAFKQAVRDLKYGSVNVNLAPFLAFGLYQMPWGSYNGTGDLRDIGSGNCFVHNGFMFSNVEKGVFYGPWRPAVYQPWGHDHKSGEGLLSNYMKFLANPGLPRLLPCLPHAIQSGHF